jgi:hypothetical protein
VAQGVFDPERFQTLLDRMQNAANEQVANPSGILEVVGDKFGFTADERKAALDALIGLGDTTKFGIAVAVSQSAEQARDYARATELEEAAGKVLLLPLNDIQSQTQTEANQEFANVIAA